MAFEWYAIQTYSGSEQSVKKAILNLIQETNSSDKLNDIIIPTEEIFEIKDKQKKFVKKSIYPGYLFIHIDLDTKLWHLIQSLPRVGRFIGESKKPTPLNESDIKNILEKIQNPPAPRPKFSFTVGESVRVVNGPFVNFTGVVESYDMENRKLILNIVILNRSVRCELSDSEVEKEI